MGHERAIEDVRVRQIELTERRARLAIRHHLAPAQRAAGMVDVARSLVALHSTDPASVFIAAWARLQAPRIEEIEGALYDERTVLRMLGMRRTMFVVPVELAPIVQGACTQALIPRQRRLLSQLLEQAGIARDGGNWLRQVEEATMEALRTRGEAYGGELAADVVGLRQQIMFGEGKKWGGMQGLSTRVLFLLAAEGRIVRGRPRGTWTSSQYRWAPAESWLPGANAALPAEAARTELARCWLRSFGPATPADLKWWTGWTAAEVRQAVRAVGAVEVELDGATGLVLDDDLPLTDHPEPWAALLPALDPTVMGWAVRDWYLGRHGPFLFDRSGNAGPTVWWDGRIVGGWAQRKDGDIAFRLFDDIGVDAVRAVEAEAGRLAAWLGQVRVTPRFRTPLERELSS